MKQGEKLKGSIRRVLTDLYDLMLLNILWALCSIPVITIGPATSALYSVMLKVARGEPVATFAEFFRAFKANFKQALVLGLIMLAGAAVIAGDFLYARSAEGSTRTLFFIVSGVAAAVWMTFVTYSFPLQARFENTLKGHIKNAFLLAFVKPGKTLLLWFFLLLPALMYLLLPYVAVAYIGWFFLIFAASLPAYLNSRILRDIFDLIDHKAAENGESTDGPEEGPDERFPTD